MSKAGNENRIEISGIEMAWDVEKGICTCAGLPVALLWIDSTMSGLLAGMEAMVGAKRFGLALQAEGRNSVKDDWDVISQFNDFETGFEAISQIAVVAGWGLWKLESIDYEKMQCRFQIENSWEGGYQKALSVNWGSCMLAGKLAGYCTLLFKTECWAEQVKFIASGDDYDEFLVSPSTRSVENEIKDLLRTDEATRADMAVVLKKLEHEIQERQHAAEERHLLEAKLQHAQKLESLGVLAGGIAHDFNNLLVSIIGNAELGLIQQTPNAKTDQHFNEIISTSQRAADLCQQLLAYSGKGKFVLSQINLSTEVKTFENMLSLSSKSKYSIEYDLQPDISLIEGDVTQIRQVIMNLMTNADEAILGTDGNISISSGDIYCTEDYLSNISIHNDAREGNYVFIDVQDDGSGMSRETLSRIFDPFYTTKFTGRGLGMAAVLGIVNGHNGAIQIDSELGIGTKFRILFPVLAAKTESMGTIIQSASDDITTHFEGTILLVDDDDEILKVCSLLLESIGFKVIVAKSGVEALEIFKIENQKISLILSDLTMPHMDGVELYEAVGKLQKNICMVISSGYNEEEVSQRFVDVGISGFIQKPYTLKSLMRILESALGQQTP